MLNFKGFLFVCFNQYPKVQLFFYTYKYLELNNVNRRKYFVAIQIIYIFANIIIKTYKDGKALQIQRRWFAIRVR